MSPARQRPDDGSKFGRRLAVLIVSIGAVVAAGALIAKEPFEPAAWAALGTAGGAVATQIWEVTVTFRKLCWDRRTYGPKKSRRKR